MNFKDLKIGMKIMTGFGIVAVITLAVGVVGYIGLERVSRSFHEVSDVRLPSIQYLGEMETSLEKFKEITFACWMLP
jgi:methyl-accepting chemotaxis protein